MLILCSSHMVSYIVSAAFSGTASAMAADISAPPLGLCQQLEAAGSQLFRSGGGDGGPGFRKKVEVIFLHRGYRVYKHHGQSFCRSFSDAYPAGLCQIEIGTVKQQGNVLLKAEDVDVCLTRIARGGMPVQLLICPAHDRQLLLIRHCLRERFGQFL